jgi:hypothetical protein
MSAAMLSIPAVRVFAVLLLLAAARTPIARADDVDVGREDQLKAAYLFNFAKFVEWPSNAKGSIRVCFIGAPGVHASLTASVAGKKIGTRAIETSLLQVTESRAGCDIIYLDAALAANVLVQDVEVSRALTVSEADDFTRRGGVIRLFQHDNRLRFDVNLDNARRASLKISSNLLKLASRVEQDGAP